MTWAIRVGLLFAMSTILCFCPTTAQEVPENRTITIGIADGLSPSFWPSVLGPTLEYLRESIPHLSIKTKEVDIHKADARSSDIDFFIAPPLFFWKELLENGASAVGMLSPMHSSNPQESTGGVLITKTNRTDIREGKDLKNKRLAVRAKGFEHEYLIFRHWLKQRGLDSETDLKEILEVGFRSPGPISSVLSGAADVGLLGYCELEGAIHNGIVDPKQIRILSPRKSENEACYHTTDLYPNIVVGAYPHSPSREATLIAASLYKMPELPGGYRWSYASGFNTLDEVAKELALGSYAYLQEWRPAALWKRFSTEICLVISLIFAVCWHIFRVNRLVNLRTLELKTALKEKQALSIKEKESREKLSALEKSSVISHISSLIAHELKQPLGAITNYSAGLKAHLLTGEPDPTIVKTVVEKIIQQAEQASSVIDFVRSYAKSKSSSPNKLYKCNVPEAVAHAVESLKLSGLFSGQLKENLTTQASCAIEPKGLELALYNLLKNAAEATNSIPNPVIEIAVRENRTFVEFAIRDNGKKLSISDVQKISKTTGSSKRNGLRLGIKIVQDIVEKSGGKLELSPNNPTGLTALVRIPKSK